MARTKKKNGAGAAPMTTSQMLGSLLKSGRDIMRKDKGLNGDLDRLPLLTWIMFLKFLDDLEQQREEEAALSSKKFKAAIEAPYRWRDWAADPQGITGDELLSFINSEEAVREDGRKAPACSLICGRFPVPTVTTAATSSLPCSRASITA
jgi:type I restriction enzyme M protein